MLIAYGAGNAFINFVNKYNDIPIKYVVDDFRCNSEVGGRTVYHPDKLFQENKEEISVLIFTFDSDVYQTISKKLYDRGFNHSDYSLPIKKQFACKMEQYEIHLEDRWYDFVKHLFFSSALPNHSSLLGTWLICGLLFKSKNLSGDAVELGVYQGGCAYCSARFMEIIEDERKYIMVDNFTGFDGLFTDTSYEQVCSLFKHFDNVNIVKGNIPQVLDSFKSKNYSFVYCDCDLYEPTLSSLKYFYPKLSKGGIFLIDDYCVTQGFLDVRKAVDEFCKDNKLDVIEIPETTHGIIIKE